MTTKRDNNEQINIIILKKYKIRILNNNNIRREKEI